MAQLLDDLLLVVPIFIFGQGDISQCLSFGGFNGFAE